MLPCQRALVSACGCGGRGVGWGREAGRGLLSCASQSQLFWAWPVCSHPEDAQEALEVHSQGAPGPLGHMVPSAHPTDGETEVQGVQLFGTYTRPYQIFFFIFFFPN